MRAIRLFKRENTITETTFIHTLDLEKATLFWVKSTQAASFSTEIKLMQSSITLPSAHPFHRLTAFIDHEGVIRVGGRLTNSLLAPDAKHPAILPKHSWLTTLIISDAHKRTLHGGTQLTLAHVKQHYWVIGGRAPVKTHILKCLTFTRQRGIRAKQLMGQLPMQRVTSSRAFEHTGVDA